MKKTILFGLLASALFMGGHIYAMENAASAVAQVQPGKIVRAWNGFKNLLPARATVSSAFSSLFHGLKDGFAKKEIKTALPVVAGVVGTVVAGIIVWKLAKTLYNSHKAVAVSGNN